MAWLCSGSDSDMVQSILYLVTVTVICLKISFCACHEMAWWCSDSDMVQSILYLVTVTMICLLVSMLATRWHGCALVLILIWYRAFRIW